MHLAADVSAEERLKGAACPGISYMWWSSQRETAQCSCCTWCHTKHLLLDCLAHVPWCCLVAVIPIPKQDLRYGKTLRLSESWGLCQLIQACHRQNCVSMVCPQVSASAESVPSTHRDITAFWEPYAQLLMASAVSVKPNKLISLDFLWTACRCSLPHHWRHVVGFLCTLSGCFQFPETCCAMLRSSLCLVLHSDKHKLLLLLNWCHLCVKWHQLPNDGLWSKPKI
jgi:hypothetical protein